MNKIHKTCKKYKTRNRRHLRRTRRLRRTRKGGNSNVVVATSNGKVMSKNAFNAKQNRLYQEPY